ncbi:TetR-like C-terminal domain-containing protein [Ileibacterium valens]|nr:TetR/AcrR family transcriptional regulator [Ileibacterium valens]
MFRKMTAKLRSAIQESFLKLALRKPVDRITVKEIVEDCDINRNSFYYHFEDLPDLIEKVVEERILNIEQLKVDNQSLEDYSLAVVQAMINNQELIRNIYNSKSRALFERKLYTITGKLVREFLETRIVPKYDIGLADQETIVRFYRNVLTGYVLEWLNSPVHDDLNTQFKRVFILRKGFFERMLERAVIEHRTAKKR